MNGPMLRFGLLRQLLARVFTPTILALALRLAGAFTSFLVTLLIARHFGAKISGEYGMAVQTTVTVSAVVVAGLDQVSLRTMAGDIRQERYDRASKAFFEAIRFVGFTSILGAGALLLAAPLSYKIGMPSEVFSYAALSLLFFPALRIIVSGLRASGRVVLSQLVDGPVQSTLLAVATFLLIVAGVRVDAKWLIFLYCASIALACIVGWGILRHSVGVWPRSTERQYESIATIGHKIVLATTTHALTSWLLMAQIGAAASANEVGAFRVSFQIITVIVLLVTTIESTVSPQFAGDFRVGRFDLIHLRHRQGRKTLILAAGLPIAICVLFPASLLTLFGPEFLIATDALRIMVIAHLCNVVIGPIGSILIMAGKDRLPFTFAVIALIVTMTLSTWLIPQYGIVGTAIGYTGGIVFRTMATYVAVFHFTPEMRRTKC